jgi:ABC-type glutathione transport system ATPase component
VKRYSSGMYVHLAFAVVAHLQPVIMLIDEVLAVGDAEFQKKCLGKMGDVARAGCAVVFISHNAAAIGSLGDRCLLLQGGKIKASGSSGAVIADYMASMMRQESGMASLTGHPGRMTFGSLDDLSNSSFGRNRARICRPHASDAVDQGCIQEYAPNFTGASCRDQQFSWRASLRR